MFFVSKNNCGHTENFWAHFLTKVVTKFHNNTGSTLLRCLWSTLNIKVSFLLCRAGCSYQFLRHLYDVYKSKVLESFFPKTMKNFVNVSYHCNNDRLSKYIMSRHGLLRQLPPRTCRTNYRLFCIFLRPAANGGG